MKHLIVFLGAGIGGVLRHAVNSIALAKGYTHFPYATLTVNVVGSLVMGMLVEYFALRSSQSSDWRLFWTTGVLGGFTTFSAFSLETGLMVERSEHGQAALYVGASVVLGLVALLCGMALVRFWLKPG